jgi:hypothetical protein
MEEFNYNYWLEFKNDNCKVIRIAEGINYINWVYIDSN